MSQPAAARAPQGSSALGIGLSPRSCAFTGIALLLASVRILMSSINEGKTDVQRIP